MMEKPLPQNIETVLSLLKLDLRKDQIFYIFACSAKLHFTKRFM